MALDQQYKENLTLIYYLVINPLLMAYIINLLMIESVLDYRLSSTRYKTQLGYHSSTYR